MPDNTQISELIADVREQVLYLQELGVSELSVEFPEPIAAELIEPIHIQTEHYIPPELPKTPAPTPKATEQPRSQGFRLAELPSLTKRTPAAIGVPPVPSVPPRNAETPETTEALFGDMTRQLPEAGETIEDIRAEIGNCTRCPLHTGRTQIVHSTGNFNADLMFVGEAPGADEDEQGFPFVGRAGQLLTKIIEGIGIKREEVFIGNINRCRPPGNRQPVPEETAACRPYLLREVAVVRPKVIVVLGNTATQNLLGIKTPISKLRGNFQDYFGVKVMPTFHPAYLLRDPHKKREVWEDMKKVRDYLAGIAT
jgi:uracil-DNA glycosylase family 4